MYGVIRKSRYLTVELSKKFTINIIPADADVVASSLQKLYDQTKEEAGDITQRIEALRFFSTLQNDSIIPFLHEVIMNSDQPALREYSLEYLSQLKSPKSKVALKQIASTTEDSQIKKEAERLIKDL